MASPWDAFPVVDEPQGDTGSGPLVVTVAPRRQAKSAPAGSEWDAFPVVKDEPSTAMDVAKSAGSGLARGAIGFFGLPGSIDSMGRSFADFIADQTVGRAVNYAKTGSWDAPVNRPTADIIRERTGVPSPGQVISGDALTDAAASVAPGIKYKPQTEAGKVAATAGEFAPGILSPGTMTQRVVGGVLAPALASEGLGRAASQISPSLEAPARLVGALAGGIGGALATRPNTAEAAIASSMRGVDDATITAAGQLMQAAQARGIALTWPEAIAQASGGGGRGLTNMQRVVEGSQGGGDIMGGFMAQRPAQMEAAARREFGAIGPQSGAPSTIGPAIGEAAERTAADARSIRSAQTRPFYERAAADEVAPEAINGVIAQLDEIIARAGAPELATPAQQLRDRLIARQATAATPATRTPVTDPNTGRVIRYEMTPATAGEAAVPHTNVGRLDEVYGSARDQFTGPAPVGQTGTEARASRYAAEALEPLDNALRSASPALAQGRQVHQDVTRQYIEPLMQGPIGKLASRDTTTREAISALFPANPLPGSAPEIVRAVGALAERNPMAARQLVRAHIESTFNEASQALQTGANQFGGAGFAAVLRGNTQQAENLAAAIQGVAGPQALKGFDQFLDIMSATGQRQRIGSQTAFNQEAQDVLRRGGMIGEAANTLATGGIKLPGRVKEAYEQWRLGQNTEQIAKLFTDPNALGLLRRLGQSAPGSSQAQAISARLAIMATQASQAANRPVP